MNEFDDKARSWDEDPAKVERARKVADAILAQAGPLAGLSALEYGCGTGLLGFALGPSLGRVTLADSSPGMLAVLKEKIAASGAANLVPLHLDLTAGPAPEARYDLVFTLMTLHHIPDTDAILEQFHGLLNPGGHLCLSDLDQEDGSFHGAGVDVHKGFDRVDLAARLARAGFGDIRFSTPFEIQRRSETGALERFPAFLAVAVRI
jgi:ubiquinone/menaquinone biosynthesis C-methylase UbiE